MIPERLVEWSELKEVLRCVPDDPCAYDHTCRNHRSLTELLTALRETQELARVHESNKETAIDEWARVERERDALQRRVEALLTELHHILEKGPGPHFDPDCPACKKEAAAK